MSRSPVIADEFVSPEAFLEAESEARTRHEYVDGLVYAMAGTTEKHGVIKIAIASHLETLVEEPCRVFDGDMKLRISKGRSIRYYYPDIFVACDPADDEQTVRTDAILVVEILSPSTELYDRTSKFERYTLLPSIREIMLVAQKKAQVELFRKRTKWTREIYGAGDTIHLESVGQDLEVAKIYRRLKL